jgi:chromosomal replication initiator protein
MNQIPYMLIPGIVRMPVNVNKIISVISNDTGIHFQQMVSRSRRQDIALARHICMWMIRHYKLMSLVAIGELFGGRDHTTCISSCNTINNWMFSDQRIKNKIENLLLKLNK